MTARLLNRVVGPSVTMATAVLLGVIAPRAAFADQAKVRAVLDEMEQAALAGDKAAYLKHVAADDPIFHKEQVNWAADFDHHKPVAFSLTIKDDAGAFTEAVAKFEMTTHWIMGEDVPGAPDRKVTFPVVFKKAGESWVYHGEDWQVLEARAVGTLPVDGAGAAIMSAGSRVKFFAGSEEHAQTIIDVLPEVRRRVDKGFGISIDRMQEVKVYKSMRHLQHSIYLSYVDPLGGWNEPHESIKILAGQARGTEAAQKLLAHEYGHVCTFEYGEKASGMPWWVLEGAAELATEEFDPEAGKRVDRIVRGWAKRDRLAPWFDMADFRKTDRKWMGNVYTQGHHMLGYISEVHGREARMHWLRAMAGGKTIDEASIEVLKMPFEELDQKWRASVTPTVTPAAEQTGATPAPPKEDDDEEGEE